MRNNFFPSIIYVLLHHFRRKAYYIRRVKYRLRKMYLLPHLADNMFAGSIQMIFFSMLICTIRSQGGLNKMAYANYFWLPFLNNRSPIQSIIMIIIFFWDQCGTLFLDTAQGTMIYLKTILRSPWKGTGFAPVYFTHKFQFFFRNIYGGKLNLLLKRLPSVNMTNKMSSPKSGCVDINYY